MTSEQKAAIAKISHYLDGWKGENGQKNSGFDLLLAGWY